MQRWSMQVLPSGQFRILHLGDNLVKTGVEKTWTSMANLA